MCTWNFREELMLLWLLVPRSFTTDWNSYPEILTVGYVSFQLSAQRSVRLNLCVGLTAVNTHIKVIWTSTFEGPPARGLQMFNHLQRALFLILSQPKIVTYCSIWAFDETFVLMSIDWAEASIWTQKLWLETKWKLSPVSDKTWILSHVLC